MAATTVPAEVPISEARALLTTIATAAKEHGARTALTRHGKTVALVVPADAGNTPHPAVWGAALASFNVATTNPQGEYRRAIMALGALLRGYFHPHLDPETAVCVHCGAEVAASGEGWVDGEGWDFCDGTSTSHEPAVVAAPNAEETP